MNGVSSLAARSSSSLIVDSSRCSSGGRELTSAEWGGEVKFRDIAQLVYGFIPLEGLELSRQKFYYEYSKLVVRLLT